MNSGLRQVRVGSIDPNAIHTLDEQTFTEPYRPDAVSITRRGQQTRLALIEAGQLDNAVVVNAAMFVRRAAALM